MTSFNEEERAFLRRVLAQWVDEGFAADQYPPVFYDVAEKLGLRPGDVQGYDIRRPKEDV